MYKSNQFLNIKFQGILLLFILHYWHKIETLKYGFGVKGPFNFQLTHVGHKGIYTLLFLLFISQTFLFCRQFWKQLLTRAL